MKIVKPFKHLRVYQIVDEDENIIKEFDDYNYQKPYQQAREYLEENN